MRLAGVVVVTQLCACSFFMNKQPATWEIEQEPSCSESDAAPAFDTIMAVGAVILSVIAVAEYHDNGGCGGFDQYGYPTQPRCSKVYRNIGAGAAGTLGFGYAAYAGQAWAGRCMKANDDHDRWLAQQHEPLPGESAELRNQCLAERAKIAAQLPDRAEAARLEETMPCEQPAPPRAHPRSRKQHSSGVGFLLGIVTALVVDSIFAGAD
jgi:hypothetical protein